MKTAIVIDPGHGGPDPGAVIDNIKEKNINLEIGLILRNFLEKEKKVVPMMTRAMDILIPLQERARIANTIGAQMFISIHCNAAENVNAKGIEVFHWPSSGRGKGLAESLAKALKEAGLNLRPNPVQPALFAVLKYTAMPAALIECGFMTNTEDFNNLTSCIWKVKFAEIMARTLTNVKGV